MPAVRIINSVTWMCAAAHLYILVAIVMGLYRLTWP